MSIMTPSSAVDDIADKVKDHLIGHGFSRQKGDEILADEDKMKAKVFELVTSKVVADKGEKSKKAWTNGELYAATFPNGPGTDPKANLDNLELEELEIRDILSRKVWNLTNPARTGYIQKRLGEDGGSLVLCRSDVMRSLDKLPGCYVTNDADLIMNDSLQPQIEALVRKADNLRKHAEMIGARHPELETRMLKALGSGVDRTVAALPRGSGETTTPAQPGDKKTR